MNFSRRDLAMLLPALAAAQPLPKGGQLPTKNYHSDQIPYKGDDRKKGREFFHGTDHSGFDLAAHETILGPGAETHPPHKHVHEEITIVVQGTAGTYVDGKTDTVEAGSLIYFGSNTMHSVHNAGTTPLRYYVLELRGKEA